MGRWADLESDEHRLPEGMKRVGYDADTQTYTFLDTINNRYYESADGNRYGVLQPKSSSSQAAAPHARTPSEVESHDAQLEKGNGEAARMLLPFALLAFVFLLLVFKFVNG